MLRLYCGLNDEGHWHAELLNRTRKHPVEFGDSREPVETTLPSLTDGSYDRFARLANSASRIAGLVDPDISSSKLISAVAEHPDEPGKAVAVAFCSMSTLSGSTRVKKRTATLAGATVRIRPGEIWFSVRDGRVKALTSCTSGGCNDIIHMEMETMHLRVGFDKNGRPRGYRCSTHLKSGGA